MTWFFSSFFFKLRYISTSEFHCSLWYSHCFSRDNFLVLDIFFEALNYETIEQKKAYDVAGLLGK